MSQTPNGGRVRRTERYAKPEDVSPQKAKRPPQPKPPIGRSAELQARMRENAQERQMPLYSDFEPTVVSTQRSQARYPNKKRRKQSHNGLWLAVALICLILSGALVVFVAPQLMNLELGDMSSFAFVNRSMIIRDQGRIDSLEACRETLQSSRIHQGVFIDGVHVGGMTREEAVQAVNAVPSSALYKKLQTLMKSNHTYETSYAATRPLYQYTDCQQNGQWQNGKISSLHEISGHQ